MYTKKLPGEIIFYYDHGDIFEDVQHQSAFMCKNLVTKEGTDLFDNYVITPDEEPMFKLCLRESVPDVFEVMLPITITDTQSCYEEITGAEVKAFDPALADLSIVAEDRYVVIRTRDNEAYNASVPGIVDSTLRTAIEQGILAAFYERVVQKELTEMSLSQAQASLLDLPRRIVGLRKKTAL